MNLKKHVKKNKILVFALLAYLGLFFYDGSLFFKSLDTAWIYIKEMIEVLPPVLIFTGLLEVWVPRDTILSTFGSKAGITGKLVSFFLGTVSAGPIYAGFPVAESLLHKGASVSNMTIILSTWAVTKLPILLIEIQFLGVNFMLARWVLTLPAILTIGYLTGKVVSREEIISSGGKTEEKVKEIRDLLPDHNCGACGYSNCAAMAKALAEGEASLDQCQTIGEEAKEEVRKLKARRI